MGDAVCSLIHSFTRSLLQKGQGACKDSCTGLPTRWGCLGLSPPHPAPTTHHHKLSFQSNWGRKGVCSSQPHCGGIPPSLPSCPLHHTQVTARCVGPPLQVEPKKGFP